MRFWATQKSVELTTITARISAIAFRNEPQISRDRPVRHVRALALTPAHDGRPRPISRPAFPTGRR